MPVFFISPVSGGGVVIMAESRDTNPSTTIWSNTSLEVEDPSRQTAPRASAARGEAERAASQSQAPASSQARIGEPEQWASECLFDYYNS
jgi:hypothetical protein